MLYLIACSSENAGWDVVPFYALPDYLVTE